jgi:hypothetical protein
MLAFAEIVASTKPTTALHAAIGAKRPRRPEARIATTSARCMAHAFHATVSLIRSVFVVSHASKSYSHLMQGNLESGITAARKEVYA